MPQVPLPGVRAALPVAGGVVGKEPVEYPDIAGGEVPVDVQLAHPFAQRPGRVGVDGDGVGLERPVVLVGAGPQPDGELGVCIRRRSGDESASGRTRAPAVRISAVVRPLPAGAIPPSVAARSGLLRAGRADAPAPGDLVKVMPNSLCPGELQRLPSSKAMSVAPRCLTTASRPPVQKAGIAADQTRFERARQDSNLRPTA